MSESSNELIYIDRIIEIREILGLAQTEFAKKIGVKPNTLTNMETYRVKYPSFPILLGICQNIENVNIDYVFTGNGKPFFTEEHTQHLINEIKNDMLLIKLKINRLEDEQNRQT